MQLLHKAPPPGCIFLPIPLTGLLQLLDMAVNFPSDLHQSLLLKSLLLFLLLLQTEKDKAENLTEKLTEIH